MLKVLIAFLVGFSTCWLYSSYTPLNTNNEAHDLRAGPSNWVNPLLECSPDAFKDTPKIKPIKKAVHQYVDHFEGQHLNSSISVYYKDLQTGAWFGLQDKEPFAVASLSKVPVLAKVLKIIESQPELLRKKILYNPQLLNLDRIENNVENKDQIIAGQEYSVEDLLSRMILKSDNISTVMIIDFFKLDLAKMFTDFGITYTRSEHLLHLTAKSYAAIFRILYNSTYINKELSEKALMLLSKSDFSYGLRRFLPQNVRVSNKFGSRKFPEKNLAQLHDCGIIYSKDPYLLCVMTRGQKLSELTTAIADISKLVYTAKKSEVSASQTN